MVEHLEALKSGCIQRVPSSILLISSQWQGENCVMVNNRVNHILLPESEFTGYKPPGDPLLALNVAQLLRNSGITVQVDSKRGLDLGLVAPLQVMFPEGKIPVIELSIMTPFDAQSHVKLGQALATLRHDRRNLLIVCSGITCTSVFESSVARRFTSLFKPTIKDSTTLDSWLLDVLTSGGKSADECSERLSSLYGWKNVKITADSMPDCKFLMPLFVAAGIGAGYPAERVLLPKPKDSCMSSYCWKL